MEKIDSLLKWATDNGADVSRNIEFKEIKPGYHGAILVSNDKASIKISRELVITCDKAIALFKDVYKEANHSSLLKVYLCYLPNPTKFLQAIFGFTSLTSSN